MEGSVVVLKWARQRTTMMKIPFTRRYELLSGRLNPAAMRRVFGKFTEESYLPSAGRVGLLLHEFIGFELLANESLICFDSNLGLQDDEPHPHVAGGSISFVARGYGDIEQDVTKGPPS
jgi:hypothetical protein